MGAPSQHFQFELTWEFLFNQMNQIGPLSFWAVLSVVWYLR